MNYKLLAGLLIAAPLLVNATPREKAEQTATARLMAAQRSGDLASDNEQYLSGKTRTEIYQRYVQSFSRPIPETFIKDTFKSE